jgi:hypothetical protein
MKTIAVQIESQQSRADDEGLLDSPFERCFNAGLHNLCDKQFARAISHFSSSLQHFYEFFVRAAAYQGGIDKTRFDAAWAILLNRPDQQYEAYVLNYTVVFDCSPTVSSDFHKVAGKAVFTSGSIPTREEAISCGQAVLNILRPALADTEFAFPHGTRRAIEELVTKAADQEGVSSAGTIRTADRIRLMSKESPYYRATVEEAIGILLKQQTS